MPGALEQRTRGEVSLLSRETLSCYGTHFSPWFWHCPSLSLIPSSSLNKITQKRTLKNMCHHQTIYFYIFLCLWKKMLQFYRQQKLVHISRLLLLSRYICHHDIFILKTFYASQDISPTDWVDNCGFVFSGERRLRVDGGDCADGNSVFCVWSLLLMGVMTSLTVASCSNESFSSKWEWPILHPSSLCCPSYLVEGKRQVKSSHLNEKFSFE